MLEYTHRNEGKTSKTMENSGTALKTLVETSKTMENSGTALKTLVETSKTKENPETAFRTLVVEIGESMNREDLQKLKFIYSVTNEEFAQVKISLDLFELLIERRQLSCDRDQLDFLANKLGSIQKPELKVLVETYITNYLSPSHIVTSSRAIQECGRQLSQVEISSKTIPERSRKRRRIAAEDKGTLEIQELYDEAMVCDSTSDSSEGDEGVSPDNDDHFYMEKAKEIALQSPDTDTKVGALVVSGLSGSRHREILGTGWNRMPKGCEDRFTWASDGEPLKQKYPYVLHGGVAAMLDALRKHADKIEGSTLYITLYPDNKDAQLIRELGIKEVVYGENKYCKKIFAQASKKLLEGIKRRKIE